MSRRGATIDEYAPGLSRLRLAFCYLRHRATFDAGESCAQALRRDRTHRRSRREVWRAATATLADAAPYDAMSAGGHSSWEARYVVVVVVTRSLGRCQCLGNVCWRTRVHTVDSVEPRAACGPRRVPSRSRHGGEVWGRVGTRSIATIGERSRVSGRRVPCLDAGRHHHTPSRMAGPGRRAGGILA